MISITAEELETIIKMARECGFAEAKILEANTLALIVEWEKDVHRIIKLLTKKLNTIKLGHIGKELIEDTKVYVHYAKSRFLTDL